RIGEREEARSLWARARAEAGKAPAVELRPGRHLPLTEIAMAQVRRGEREGGLAALVSAREATMALSDDLEKAYSLGVIVRQQRQAGDEAAARATLEAALKFVRDSKSPLLINERERFEASLFAEAGDDAGILRLIAEFEPNANGRQAIQATLAYLNLLVTAVSILHDDPRPESPALIEGAPPFVYGIAD